MFDDVTTTVNDDWMMGLVYEEEQESKEMSR
jgi:hypothetical protein